MSRYRITFGFSQGNFSPTETYISADLALATLGTPLQKLIDARNAMLFDTTTWIGVRISLAGALSAPPVLTRSSKLYIPGPYSLAVSGINLTVPGKGLIPAGTTTGRSDQARAALQVVVGHTSDRFTQRYLSLVPDDVLYDEQKGVYFPGSPGWATLFSNWQGVVAGGSWSLQARRIDAGYQPVPIQGWTQTLPLPSIMGVQVDAGAPIAVVPGDKVSIKGTRRAATDTVSYNGIYRVKTVLVGGTGNPNTIYLANSEGGTASTVKIFGTITKVGYEASAISSYTTVRACTHKRGNSFAAPVGRRKIRRSLV